MKNPPIALEGRAADTVVFWRLMPHRKPPFARHARTLPDAIASGARLFRLLRRTQDAHGARQAVADAWRARGVIDLLADVLARAAVAANERETR